MNENLKPNNLELICSTLPKDYFDKWKIKKEELEYIVKCVENNSTNELNMNNKYCRKYKWREFSYIA